MCQQIKEQADAELAQFQKDLLESVRQMRAGTAASTTGSSAHRHCFADKG